MMRCRRPMLLEMQFFGSTPTAQLGLMPSTLRSTAHGKTLAGFFIEVFPTQHTHSTYTAIPIFRWSQHSQCAFAVIAGLAKWPFVPDVIETGRPHLSQLWNGSYSSPKSRHQMQQFFIFICNNRYRLFQRQDIFAECVNLVFEITVRGSLRAFTNSFRKAESVNEELNRSRGRARHINWIHPTRIGRQMLPQSA
jgi:hypothetical protein